VLPLWQNDGTVAGAIKIKIPNLGHPPKGLAVEIIRLGSKDAIATATNLNEFLALGFKIQAQTLPSSIIEQISLINGYLTLKHSVSRNN
jgi:hypothetical protein